MQLKPPATKIHPVSSSLGLLRKVAWVTYVIYYYIGWPLLYYVIYYYVGWPLLYKKKRHSTCTIFWVRLKTEVRLITQVSLVICGLIPGAA